MKRFTGMAVLASALGAGGMGCTPAAPTATPGELLEVDRSFAKATAERGAEGWGAYFAEEGRLLSDGQAEIRGREAIRQAVEPFLSATGTSLTWEPEGARLAASGDLGYTWGTYVSTQPGADGEPEVERGRYLTIWRRQADGSWKVELDMGNDLPPAP